MTGPTVGDATARTVRIGISACFFHPDPDRKIFTGKTLLYLEQSMARWVQDGGALAYLIPNCGPHAPVGVTDYVRDLDGLLLHGGSDVCPRSYGDVPLRPEWEGDEIRDVYELELVRAFHAAGKPVLGICRGQQIINVAFGGTLWQDQREQGATERVHRDAGLYDRNMHTVDIVEGSGLAALYPGLSTVLVNSVHHQAVKDLGAGLVVEARSSDDGIIEAVRLWNDEDTTMGNDGDTTMGNDGDTTMGNDGGPAGDRYVVGVQWHPEFFEGVDDGTMLDNGPIRREFLDAAVSWRDRAHPVSGPQAASPVAQGAARDGSGGLAP